MDNIQYLITDNLHIWSTALDEKKSGRGRGSNNKDKIYGIKKLRELILDLAVRGKLVPQDPNDEPASELLKRIEAEKQELTKQGKIKNEKPLSPITEAEKSFHLPVGWAWAKLGRIAHSSIGLTYSPKDIVTTGGSIVLRSSNIQNDEICLDDLIRVGSKVPNNLLVHSGDILICARNGSRSLVGKAAVISDLEKGATFGAFMALIRCPVNQYLIKYIQSPPFRKALDGVETTTINQITQGNLINTVFPLPPLAEQHRIVAKVDELMKLCDDLEAGIIKSFDIHGQLVETLLNGLCNAQNNDDFNSTWQIIYNNFETLFTTEESIEKLKQSILQLAIMGKLVPQDPNDEPASELLKRIATEKQKLIAEGKLKKEKPLPPITQEEKPFDLPRGWCFTKLSELGEFGRGKSKHRPRNEPKLFQNGIYPLVQTGEVSRADWVINEYHSKYSDFGLAQSKIWPKNTLCITIAANIADAAILGFDACFPDSVVGLVCTEDNVKIDYIMYYMKTARNDLIKFAPSTAQKNINLEILSQILVPIPPLNEQKRIVAKVEELMALCDALKSKITLANQTKITLANNISQQIDIA